MPDSTTMPSESDTVKVPEKGVKEISESEEPQPSEIESLESPLFSLTQTDDELILKVPLTIKGSVFLPKEVQDLVAGTLSSDKQNELAESLSGKFQVSSKVKGGDIQCIIKPQSLQFKWKGSAVDPEFVYNDELIGKIDCEESTWEIESRKVKPKPAIDKLVNGQTYKELVITLVKQQRKKQWKCIGKKEAELIQKNSLKAMQNGGGSGKSSDFNLLTASVNQLNPDDNSELADKNLNDEKILEAEFLRLRKEKGIEKTETLKTFFELFDNSIQLYRLNMLSNYLEDIVPVCRKRSDEYKIKAIQAYGFVLWKQNKFKQALPLFLEMEDLLGQNGALCENIAHTYNSLGQYEKAEKYFSSALKYCQNDDSDSSQKGGVLLGLGLVRDRQGKVIEAEKIVRQSWEFYRRRAQGRPLSLQAKAGVALAKILIKKMKEVTTGIEADSNSSSEGQALLQESEKLLRDAVYVYEVTCGKESPLTCSAYQELGSLQWKHYPSKRVEARKNLSHALQIACRKDQLDIIQLMECHQALVDTITQATDTINRFEFKDFLPVIREAEQRLLKEKVQDGNTGVYYKLCGEFYAWSGEYSEAKTTLERTKKLLEVEKSIDPTRLVNEVKAMIGYCERCLNGSQDSPMALPVTDDKKAKEDSETKEEGGGEEEGIEIEEVAD